MIPKIIHYCWFGNNPMPQHLIAYMATWKQQMPEWDIRAWDETTLVLQTHLFMYYRLMKQKSMLL
jgi:mannosyltransferase OCH1-like enzyme